VFKSPMVIRFIASLLRPSVYLILLITGLVTFSSTAISQCLGKTSGRVTLKVSHCKQIEPKSHFAESSSVPLGFYDLYSTKEIVQAFRTYRGYLVVGEIQRSEAVDPVLSDHQALLGQKVTVFIESKEEVSCQGRQNKGRTWTGNIAQVCCDDSISAPCLLDTSYVLSSVRTSGKAARKVAAGSVFKEIEAGRSTSVPEVKKARDAFRKGQVRKAIELYEFAEQHNKKLSLIDHYVLGISYYLIDGGQCGKGIAHLEKVHSVVQTIPGRLQEGYMKRSQLLLARCHSLAGNADRAVLLLREMLTDPDSFKEQLEIAMRHEDFGWINSTRQYQSFIKEALRAF